MNRTLLIAYSIVLSLAILGCARPHMSFQEYTATSISPSEGYARFILFRPKDSFQAQLQGGARAVRIKIDGQVAGYVRGGFKTFDVPVGKHTIGVDLWDRPGSCQLEFEATAGKEYFFHIGPRRELVTRILGDLVGALIVESVGVGNAVAGGAILGSVGTAQVNFCNGDFAIKALMKDAAISQFADLKRN